MRRLILSALAGLLLLASLGGCTPREGAPLGMAVEYMNHAACAYISQDKGWYEQEGLKLSAYESYVTGMALASALGRGDIEVAYICLVPAINAYANAGVPIKIVAGTHKYGYGLVVDPDKIDSVSDLVTPGMSIGCVREGGAMDVLMNKTVEHYNLDKAGVVENIRRMNPAQQVIAIRSGQLDAAFLPEQWATMAEEYGFVMLLTSQDIWPRMQGSVLIVKQDLIAHQPEVVSKLVKVSQRAIDWGNDHPAEAAGIMARQMSLSSEAALPARAAEAASQLEMTPEVMLRSMGRMEFTTALDPEMIQQTIDYLVELGYIKSSFAAANILDTSFLE